jgi:hypothetical protein
MFINIKRLALLIPFFIFLSCHNSVEPVSITPGRRDYTWTVDTVKIPFSLIGRMAGSSPQDIYAVAQEDIYHYDGSQWKTSGISMGMPPITPFSFNQNDVWVAGYEGKIWHFDGHQWAQSLDFKKANYYVGFEDIWGDSPKNIYAVGYADSSDKREAIIVHYNGIKWSEEIIPFYPDVFLRIKKDIAGTGKYYLLGYANSTEGFLTGLFEYDGVSTITKIYEKLFSLDTHPDFEFLGNQLYFVIGRTINTYENSQFKSFLNVNQANFIDRIWGRSINDIFLIMNDGIAHYNGTDIQYIFRNNNIRIDDAVIFEKEIFFCFDDLINNQNLIIHGVLK